MQSKQIPVFRRFQSGIKMQYLLMFWTFGIILGVTAGRAVGAGFSSVMTLALQSPASLSSLVICNVLPFALTAAVVVLNRPRLIYFLCTVKAFSFGICGIVCLICFGEAGWLVRFLLFFSQLMTVPAIWFFWIQLCKDEKGGISWGLRLLPAYLLMVVLLDHFVLTPYLVRLV